MNAATVGRRGAPLKYHCGGPFAKAAAGGLRADCRGRATIRDHGYDIRRPIAGYNGLAGVSSAAVCMRAPIAPTEIPAASVAVRGSSFQSDDMLPSLFASEESLRPWSLPRAALYGAGVGLLAALFKIFGPLHAAEHALPRVLEIAGVVVIFAVLCAGAALLRNRLARRLRSTAR